MVEPEPIAFGVHVLPFEIGQVYLWEHAGGLTIVDAGVTGSAAAILRAVEALGYRPGDVRDMLLTHGHADHTGGAAALAAMTGAEVLAHPEEAAVVRGEQPARLPDLADWERPLAAAILPRVPSAPPVGVDREVREGDTIAGGEGVVIGVPGHTPGSIALLLPSLGVLFAGDALATREGRPMLGVFNVDRQAASASVRRLALHSFSTLCVGHGAPLVGDAGRQVRALARTV